MPSSSSHKKKVVITTSHPVVTTTTLPVTTNVVMQSPVVTYTTVPVQYVYAPVVNTFGWVVEHDADKLHKAMKGLGTDEKDLIHIIGGRSREHLVMVAAAYADRHHHELIKDLKSDTSFNFKALLVGLVKPYGDYLADCIGDAIIGAGTKEHELIDIITQLSPPEMMLLHETWNRRYASKHGSLEKAISGDTSHNFKKTLLHTIRGSRMHPGQVDMTRVHHDAKKLYKAGEHKLGTDEKVFIDICSQSSAEHLQLVSADYEKKHKHGLEVAIKKETSGDFKDALLALCTPRPRYTAIRIHDAVHGLGTNDSLLVRQFTFNDRAMLQLAAAEYQAMFKHAMKKDVKGDTSGDYKKLLSRLMKPI